MTGEDIARAYWEHSRRRDPMLPRWEGLAPDLRKNRAKDYQSMLDDGWTFTPLFSIGYGSRPDFREGVRFARAPLCRGRLQPVGGRRFVAVRGAPPGPEAPPER